MIRYATSESFTVVVAEDEQKEAQEKSAALQSQPKVKRPNK